MTFRFYFGDKDSYFYVIEHFIEVFFIDFVRIMAFFPYLGWFSRYSDQILAASSTIFAQGRLL